MGSSMATGQRFSWVRRPMTRVAGIAIPVFWAAAVSAALLQAIGLLSPAVAAEPPFSSADHLPRLVEVQARGAGAVRSREIEVAGRTRRFLFYVPRGLGRAPAPLIIAFHGGGQTPDRFARGIGLREMADRHGFAVALPVGVAAPGQRGGSWNTGSAVPQGYAEEQRVDDLAFVSRIIDEAVSTGRIDPARIYAMGVSRGGMMSYYAACRLGGQISAVAVVAGTLTGDGCPDAEDLSVLHIHGTDDENVPFGGGTGQFSARGVAWPSAQSALQTIRQGAACESQPTRTQVAEDTVCETAACPGADHVELCLVEGGGHSWPGGETTARQERRGVYTSPHFDATEHIARFFKSH